MTYKEKLQKRFEELDKKPHVDYRIIAFTLAMDYHKLDLKYKRLEKDTTKELENQKEDKKVIYDAIAELYDYIEDTDCIEKEYIYDQLATMQNFAK